MLALVDLEAESREVCRTKCFSGGCLANPSLADEGGVFGPLGESRHGAGQSGGDESELHILLGISIWVGINQQNRRMTRWLDLLDRNRVFGLV